MNPDALSSAVFIAARIVARWALDLPLGTYAVTADGDGSHNEPRAGPRERLDPVRVRNDLVVAFVAGAAQRRMSAGTRSAMEAARGAGEMSDGLTRASEVLGSDVAADVVAREALGLHVPGPATGLAADARGGWTPHQARRGRCRRPRRPPRRHDGGPGSQVLGLSRPVSGPTVRTKDRSHRQLRRSLLIAP
jgi:hypothetical protein